MLVTLTRMAERGRLDEDFIHVYQCSDFTLKVSNLQESEINL